MKLQWAKKDGNLVSTNFIAREFRIVTVLEGVKYHLFYGDTQLNTGNGYDFASIPQAVKEANRFAKLI